MSNDSLKTESIGELVQVITPDVERTSGASRTRPARTNLQQVRPDRLWADLALGNLVESLSVSRIQSHDEAEVAGRILELLQREIGCSLFMRIIRNADGELRDVWALGSEQLSSDSHQPLSRVRPAVLEALAGGKPVAVEVLRPKQLLVAIPKRRTPSVDTAYCFSLDCEDRERQEVVEFLERCTQLLETLASDADCTGAPFDQNSIELFAEKVDSSDNPRQTIRELAVLIREQLGCDIAVIGRQAGDGGSRVEATSVVSEFNATTDLAEMFADAIDEAVARERSTAVPSADIDNQHSALCHIRLMHQSQMQSVASYTMSIPGQRGQLVIIALSSARDAADLMLSRLQKCVQILRPSLSVMLCHGFSMTARIRRKIEVLRSTKRLPVMLATAVAVSALLAVPVDHRIKSVCVAEPVTRRFVQIPFDGTLDHSLVQPGEAVAEGQVLARMDRHDLDLQMTALKAERVRQLKVRQSAQAAGQYGESQIAALEVDRIDAELAVLENHARQLAISSPLAGIVVEGDHENSAGARVTAGQSLFEIAPLDEMTIELEIDETAVSHIKVGQQASIELHALPGREWTGVIDRVEPRAEIRDDRNVFIVAVRINNGEGLIQPGMQGRAYAMVGKQSLGRNLFEGGYERVRAVLHALR